MLILIAPIFAQSQTPIPFPTQDATWLYGLYDDFGNLYGYHQFWLDGDSSYLGETWSVLYHGGSPEGLIRQDTSLKVWIVPTGLTTPEFLYDFGTVVGDTIRGIRTQFITTLDTVVVEQIFPGPPQVWSLRSISSQAMGMYYTWTEGVGDESWLPASSPINLVSGTTYLICFANIAYNGPNNPCIVANEEALSQQLKIYPNPSTGKFRVDFDQPGMLGAMKVMDAQGRAVWSDEEFRGTLDLSGFEPGIYFLSVRSGEETLTRKLVVK